MKNDIKYHINGNNVYLLEQYIIKNKPNLDYLDEKDCYAQTYLMIAAYNGKLNMIKLLLKYGADPTIKNFKKQDLIYTIVINAKLCKKISIKDIPQLQIYNWIKLSSTQDELINKFPFIIFSLKKYKILRKNIEQKYIHILQSKELNLI